MSNQIDVARDELCTLMAQRELLDKRIDDARRAVQALCDHQWRLHQVAGDGRYCIHCGLNDPFFDD